MIQLMSIRARKRLGEIGFAGLIVVFAWLLQVTVLTKLSLDTMLCSLPLAITITWGAVFGSPLRKPTPEELRMQPVDQAIMMQIASGSVSGLIIGAIFASFYLTMLPIYPISYPIVGWLAGYFSLKSFNKATLLCIPLVLGGTVFAESITALQLHMIGRPEVLPRLAEIAFPEAILNSLIAPFIYFPMRAWFEFFTSRDVRE
ncbi:MAG: rod shape-determining protein MreD [Candidatus Melainabacteria bacterium]|nr:rod shape-determining protein MreD [Candidatus Melainabacteria bacterium]